LKAETSPQIVDHDGFDREVYESIRGRFPAVDEATQRLGRLLPHGEALVFDLFSVLYKLNVRVRPKAQVDASALMNRRIVRSVFDDPRLDELRARCALDAERAGEALGLLAHRVAEGLTTGDRVVASELMTGMEADQDERELYELKAQRAHLKDVDWPDDVKGPLARALDDDIRRAKSRIKTRRGDLDQSAEQLPVSFDHDVGGALDDLNQGMGELDEAMGALGLGSGNGKVDSRLRLELGHRLSKSKKLRLLARLVGAFKEVAFEARRKKVSRSPQTLHDVAMGRDLDHLLPAELLGLRPGPLHREFRRRYAENQLLHYALEGPKSKGPMVVCVDGSSSMHGSSEIWAKAVALTLVELARRQRRRCWGIIFSGGPECHEVELAAPRATSLAPQAVFEFAEHFPGGGTSFTEPLERALQRLTDRAYRRGDIVFITDGEAHVPPELVTRVDEARRRQGFKVRSVGIGDARLDTLKAFSDDVRRVDPASDSLADLFYEVD
jgi:uncharacterized protein with von Willebrand factor type A (vWA) domain